MTREAKIGMLTGLGVIVLIGVLLSEYLGGPATVTSSTGRMATLPLGETYRQEVMQPVGVPGSAPRELPAAGGVATVGPAQPLGALPVMPVAPGMSEVPKAYASMDTREGAAIESGNPVGLPVIGQPVSAVPAGELPRVTLAEGNVPTLNLDQSGQTPVYVAGQSAAATTGSLVLTDNTQPKGDTYVIVSGDSLPKIAKKFYKSSKDSDVARIVAANTGVLKNGAKTVLMVGKKLFIPAVVKAAGPVIAAKAPSVVKTPVVIAPPAAKADGAAVAAKKDVPTVYVVQKGDTLGKIAHELFPGSAVVMGKKIMAANGLKNADDIQIGEKLKIPAKI